MSHERLKPYQVEHLAICIASGHPAEVIAEATQISREKIDYFLNQYRMGANEHLQQLVARYRMDFTSGAVRHRIRMREQFDRAYEVIEDTLNQDKDLKLRYDAAWDVLGTEDLVRARDKQAAPQNQFNVFADQRAVTAISATADSVRDLITDMKGKLSPLGDDRNLIHDSETGEVARYAAQQRTAPSASAGGNGSAEGEIEIAVETSASDTPVAPEEGAANT